jgi:predicted kinase
VLVINTFATKKSRQRFTALAKEMKKTIGAVYLNMPLEHCLAHYKSSNPTLPENVLRSMFHKQELLDKAEGFTEILTLHP